MSHLNEIMFTGLLVLAVAALCALLAIWLARSLKVKADHAHTLRLTNLGNFRSQYHLSARSTRPELAFSFLVNDIPLIAVMEEEPETPIEAPKVVETQAKKPDVKLGSAVKTGEAAAAKTGAVANMLGILGGILPGKLGAGLRDQSGAVRQVQTNTVKVAQAPASAQRKADVLSQAGGKLGVKTSAAQTQSSDKGNGSHASGQNGQPDARQPGTTPVAVQLSAKRFAYVETEALDPGESMTLTLRIGTTQKRYPVGSFKYEIRSQQIPLNERLGKPDPLVNSGTVYFKPIGIWRYWMPLISVALVVVCALLGIFWGLSVIWG